MNFEDNEQNKRLSQLFSSVDKNSISPDKKYLEQLREKSTAEFIVSSADKAKNPQTKTLIPIWTIIMRSKITKFAAVAVIILTAIFSISLFDKTLPVAYSVEQTIEAIRKIDTVYMAGEFYKQGQFECWMQFDDKPDLPTHVWLGKTGHNLCKICSPDGVFGLNKRTNRVHFATRDERGMSWIPKFISLFETATQSSDSNSNIDIYNENDPKTEKSIIIIKITTPKREQRFLIDSRTKLPIKFETIRDDNPAEMMQKTLAIKNLSQITYNQQPPEGIFNLPADAVTVKEEVDCIVDPDSGLISDGMTTREACLEIVKKTGQAIMKVDIKTMCSLDLFFRTYPLFLWEQIKQMKDAGQWVNEFNITGEPYQENGLWYVPFEIKTANGQSEKQNVMIKFYNMEGKTYCFIIGSKEKGVVD